MRTLLHPRQKPRPLPEPPTAAATTNAENPAIDTMKEPAISGEAAVEAGDVGGGGGGWGSAIENVTTGTRGLCIQYW
jgi:hypothetical protein